MVKKVCAFVALLAFGSAFAADNAGPWYVDDDWYGKGGTGTQDAPYGTIQEAIDAATTLDGHTILVLPGVYTNGVNREGDFPCRVYVDKKLTIRSTEGREKTHIVGHADSGDHGVGPEAVSGILIVSKDVIVEGFTIRDGHSPATGDSTYMGCGVRGVSGGNTHLIDCTVRDCGGQQGLVRHINVHRCQIGPNNWGNGNCGLYGAPAENSIIIGNAGNPVHYQNLVNCTVINNEGASSASGGDSVTYNSIYAMNFYDYDTYSSQCNFSNSVTTVSADKFGHHSASVFDVPKTNLFVAPLFNDFRLKSDSPAVGVADPKWLTKVPLPAGYVYCDYLGQEIDMNASAINAGAVQTTAEAKSGCYFVDDNVSAHEGFVRPGSRMNFAFATAWPTQWCVTAASPDTAPLAYVTDSTQDYYRRYSGSDGAVWIMPPPVGTDKTVKAQCAQVFRYVDPEHGDDGNDGTRATKDPNSKAGPWKTLQCAVTNCCNSKQTTIYCAPGVYDKGSGHDGHMNARIFLRGTSAYDLFFVAPGGAANTVIKGASHDPSVPDSAANSWGVGENALRCLSTGSGVQLGFRGFTFMDGHSAKGTYSKYGGLCYGDSASTFVECCISNNVGWSSAVFGKVLFEDCVLTGNRAANGGGVFAFMSTYVGCQVMGNFCAGTGALFSGNEITLLNSTVVQAPGDNGRAIGSKVKAYNTIFSDFADRGASEAPVEMSGCLLDNTTISYSGLDYVSGDPFYFDKSNGDFSLMRGSAAVGVATADNLTVSKYAGRGATGEPLFLTGAPLAAGAVQRIVRDGVAVRAEQGGLKVVGREPPLGNYHLAAGETLTVAADVATAQRPISGILVNDVTNAFTSGWSLMLSYEDVIGAGGIAIRPIYSNEWFVNANTDPQKGPVGNDANSGISPDDPRLTLAAALSDARLVTGDVVTAAPGVYSNGTMNTKGLLTAARAEIKSGVTLRASGRVDETVIMGAKATEDADEHGCGADAVRCVYLEQNAQLKGFTLSGGYSQRGAGSSDADNNAAAIRGSSSSDSTASYVSGCVITNCHANNNLIYDCVLVNSRVVNCDVASSAILNYVNSFGCYFAGNSAKWEAIVQCDTTENCTWAGNNVVYPTGGGIFKSLYAKRDVRNSVIIGKLGTTDINVYNCVVRKGGIPANMYFMTNTIEMTEAEMALDADGRPIPGVSPVTELGDASIATAQYLGKTDLSGVPRIQNGAMDPGALEADWRPRYAEDIGRKITVDDVTADVTETENRTVKVPDGDALALTWSGGRDGATQRRVVRLMVSGEGQLTVTRNGAEKTVFLPSAGEQEYVFDTVGAEPQKLTFAYSGDADGFAEILGAKVQCGMILIVR